MNTTSYVGILLLLAGAPKDRDGGICESLVKTHMVYKSRKHMVYIGNGQNLSF